MSKGPRLTNSYADRDKALKQARAILKMRTDASVVPPTKTVGTFGIIDNGYRNMIAWVVGPRKDRRYGVVDTPAPKDPYHKELFDAMFRKWGDE